MNQLRMVAALTERNLYAAVIGIEATSVYGDNLMCFLREDGGLGQFERKLHVLNPKQVNKLKRLSPNCPRTIQ